MRSAAKISEELIKISHRLEEKGFVAATDGNISARLSDGNILATPSSMNKGFVTASDLVQVTLTGKQVKGKRKPSTEIKMHLFIYQQRADVNAVVHAHPVYATGFAAAGIPLKENVFPEVAVGFGNIPLADYATPSTDEVAASLLPFVEKYDAVLLSNHGVVTYGHDLWDAYFKMEKVEQIARMLFVAEHLGGAQQLNKKQLLLLQELSNTIYKK